MKDSSVKPIFHSNGIWLITWQASTLQKLKMVRGSYIVTLIDGRVEGPTIAKITKALYVSLFPLTVFEKAVFATKTGYKKHLINSSDVGLRIGLNPWLYARAVSDFKIFRNGENFNVLWREPTRRQSANETRAVYLSSFVEQEYVLGADCDVVEMITGCGFKL